VTNENLAGSLRLVAVTDDRVLEGRDPVALLLAAVQGGATAVQLRLKQVSPRELSLLTRRLVGAASVPVIVNDRLDVALAAGAQGVHLGADDFPVDRARRIAPDGFVIGASVGDPDEAARAGAADYWGVGPWRTTGTKADAGPALGEEGFARLVRLAAGRPCVAIGAVRPADVPLVRRAGGVGVAVVSGLFADPDPAAAARRYLTNEASPRSTR
jgi:thiamine-phosphate diphosphorylase